MSDLLTSLIARSQGLWPVIRPRLPSIYEPERARSGALGITTDTELVVPEDVVPAAFVPIAQPQRGAHPALRAFTQMRAAPVPSLVRAESTEPRESARPFNAPAGTSDFVARARPAVLETTHRSVREISESEMVPPIALPLNREPIVPVVGGLGTANMNRGDRPQLLRVLGHHVAGPLPPAQPEVPHRPSAESRTDEEEPAVHVTIGRVDVRAVHPTPPATRTKVAKSRPHLSLDEYLKQRDGGRR